MPPKSAPTELFDPSNENHQTNMRLHLLLLEKYGPNTPISHDEAYALVCPEYTEPDWVFPPAEIVAWRKFGYSQKYGIQGYRLENIHGKRQYVYRPIEESQ